MAGVSLEKFEEYFQKADVDRDGRISGAEAVAFLQIWMHADQNRIGFLSHPEFYNALGLVTVSQSKRELKPDIVKAALYGHGKTVALTLKSSTTIVAYGTVVKLDGLLHGGPMPKSCARVSVDQVIDENALLLFPTSDIGTSVGDALGTHVAWPIHLLSQKEKLSTKKKGVQKVAKENKYTIKSFASLPATLKVICRYAETLLKDGRAIDMSLSPDLFGSSLDLHLHIEDIAPFCNLDPISANCIVAYVRHLYKKMRNMKLKEKEMFVWVNPFDISYNPSGNHDDRARLLADRLAIASTDQQVLIPCNVG